MSRYGEPNLNVEFLGGRGWWIFYALILIGARSTIGFVASVIFPDLVAYSTTVLAIIHSVITLWLLHWVKGTTFFHPQGDQGLNAKLTFWEQIDGGTQNTTKKKVFTIVPVIICILACQEANWDPVLISINFVSLIIANLGKLPFMHRYRILGINKE